MTDDETGDRLKIPLDPEQALRGLLKVDPDSEPVEHASDKPCPKMWNGKRCKLQAGHAEPHAFDVCNEPT